MSYCYSVMTNYPNFSDNISRDYLKNINGKISLKTHSKITRLVNQNFTIDKNFKRVFNEDYTSCDIEFKISNESKNYNSTLNLIFRTEKMNEPLLKSQYNPQKDETSYIFGMIYDQKPIPVPEKPDTDLNINYYAKYQSNEKTETPSIFIFLIDQSGSMSGSAIRLVSESLLFFLQSLPKDSYFQLIGFGSTFKKINNKPLLYNKENVKNTMDIIKNLKADLGGTDISSPLKEIFNSKDYDEIKLGRNLFILTDGEVDNREECLELISTNCEKFKVHAIGIGSSFDKKLIQNAGIQGKGSYHFVNNVSDVNSIIIQSLSKCLREYLLDVKISLDTIKPEYEFLPKNNFIYPEEILYYYFIIKGNNINDKIQINFESSKKNENIIFQNEKIVKENDGEIIGQIIIGNILKNSDGKLDENMEIKLSKDYQILSKKTALFAVGEGEGTNKIAEFKQVKKKERPKLDIFNSYNYPNNNIYNFNNNNNNMNSNSFFGNYNNNRYMNNMNNSYNYGGSNSFLNNNNPFNNGSNLRMMNSMGMNNMSMGAMNMNNMNMGSLGMNNMNMGSLGMNNMNNMNMRSLGMNNMNNMNMGSLGMNNMLMGAVNHNMSPMMNPMMNMNMGMMNDFEMRKQKKMYNYMLGYKVGNLAKSSAPSNKDEALSENKRIDFDDDKGKASPIHKNLEKLKEDEKLKKDEILENVVFSPKELVLTQDIFDGCWGLNPQTKALIEKEKELYEKIEKLMKEKNIEKEEIIITLFVLYYLNNDTSINKIEYSLIIKKGIKYLETNGVNYEEITVAIQK